MLHRPSIILINRVYPPTRGATGRVLRDLARGFARDGWQVYVLTTGPKAVRERDGSVKVMRIKAAENQQYAIGYFWIWLRLFVAALRLPKADIVVSMTDPPMLSVVGRMVAFFRKSRHIHWCQDLYPDVLGAVDVHIPAFFERQLKKLSRRTMQRADKNIVIGRCMAKHLSHTGIDPRKITVIPNWPDQELITGESDESAYNAALEAVPEFYGSKNYDELLKDGPKFRVLYAGNIGRAHPVDTILRAAESLNETNPEIEFTFVGDGAGFDKIAHARARRGLQNIRLLPYQPNSRLKEVMESGDIHIISMKDEAAGCLVPSKLYSALAVARPCIFVGPEACEAAKVIRDFKAGQVVQQGRVRELVDAILLYRNDGDLWFKAHEGALEAGKVFIPSDSMEAWISRARDIAEPHEPRQSKKAAA